jgi:hypothetical protein
MFSCFVPLCVVLCLVLSCLLVVFSKQGGDASAAPPEDRSHIESQDAKEER